MGKSNKIYRRKACHAETITKKKGKVVFVAAPSHYYIALISRLYFDISVQACYCVNAD